MAVQKIRYLVLILILFAACKQPHKFKESSYYYWKTEYAVSSYERDYLEDVGTNKIYFKAFDVVDQEPIGVMRWTENVLPAYTYIPVVFIDNEIFRTIDTTANKMLAQNVNRLIEGVCLDRSFKPQEIQIDCDWTKGTRKNYFYFLKQLKKLENKQISVTIRLHQIKFKKSTGIPPCDYGVLMCYNMGDMKNSGAQNSIYNAGVFNSYLKNAEYRLPLKPALPIFNWLLWYRGERFMGILTRAENIKQLAASGGRHANGFVINKDTVINKHAFEQGDFVRDETISSSDLANLKEYLSVSKLKLLDEIIYFSLDSINLSQYEKSTFTP